MSSKIWAVSSDGTIAYKLISSRYVDGALELMRTSFFLHENICAAVGLDRNSEAIDELEGLSTRAAADGVSVVAIEIATDRVVGAALNKLQVLDKGDGITYFANYARSCKHDESRAILQFMVDVDGTCNLFELCNVDCMLELMFLATSPEFWGRGIGEKLCAISVQITQALMNGENVKQSIYDGEELSLEPIPKAVTVICTSFITQKIVHRLGFAIAKTLDFGEFNFKGKPLTSAAADNKTLNITLEYLKL